MRVTLPYPPSANRYWRSERGRVHRSKEADDYKAHVAWLCKLAGMEPVAGDVRVFLDFYRPAKRGDLDNGIKVALDALNGFAYVDDSQIVEICACRFEDKHNPRLEIIVTEAMGEPEPWKPSEAMRVIGEAISNAKKIT